MPDDKQVFGKEYDIGTETNSVSSGPSTEKVYGNDVDVQKYGVNKPKRVIIRAEIIHDQS